MNASSTIALNTENFKIKSSEGHVDFYGVNKITKDCYVHLKFSNGKELKCSEDHPISTIDGIIRAKNLNKKQEIETEDGHCFIVSKRIIKRKFIPIITKESMFDFCASSSSKRLPKIPLSLKKCFKSC